MLVVDSCCISSFSRVVGGSPDSSMKMVPPFRVTGGLNGLSSVLGLLTRVNLVCFRGGFMGLILCD